MRSADRDKPRCHICHKTSSSLLVGFKMQQCPVRPCAQCGKIICEKEVVRHPDGNGKLKVIGCKSCAVVPMPHHRKKSKAAKRVNKSPHRWLLP